MKDGLTCLGAAVLFAFLIVLSVVLDGWVLSILWGWFVVPQFGISTLSVPYAIGLALVVRSLTWQGKDSSDNKEKDWGKIAGIVLSPLFVLFIGWIVLQFI